MEGRTEGEAGGSGRNGRPDRGREDMVERDGGPVGRLTPDLRARIDQLLDSAGLRGADRREVREELEDHLLTGLARGRSPEELLARFGDPDVAAPLLRRGRRRLAGRRGPGPSAPGAGRPPSVPARLLRELLHALRRLAARPRFAATAVGTVAAAVGAGTLVLALVEGVLLRPLPYPDPERLVAVEHSAPGWGFPELATASDGLYAAYRASGVLEELGLYRVRAANVTAGARPARTRVAEVTPSLLTTLGAGSAAGRLFGEEEGRPGGSPVALLTHGLWQEAYGGAAAAVGADVTVDGRDHRIVGVLAADFVFPGDNPRLLIPHRLDAATAGTGDMSYRAVGRLPPGVGAEATAEALTATIGPAVEARPGLNPAFVADGPLEVRIRSLQEREVAGVRDLLLVLLGAMVLLAALAAANLATLYLVRGEHRGVELAVRAALGGGRGDLRATFAAEALLLAAAGGAVGLALAAAGLPLLVRAGVELPRLGEVTVVSPALAGGSALALALAAVTALAPRLPCGELVSILRSGSGQSRTGGWIGGGRGLLVAAQIALALVLVVASGLMLRTGRSLARVEPGYRPGDLLLLDVALAPADYPGEGEALAFHRELRAAAAALPGVRAVSLSTGVPVRDPPAGRAVLVREWIGTRDQPGGIMETRFVEPGHLETLGIPVLRGRAFQPADARTGARAAIVSAILARELWPEEDPLGREIRMDGDDPDAWYRVVGVAGDTRDEGLQEEPPGVLYLPLGDPVARAGHEVHTLTYAFRTDVEPGMLAGAVRDLLRARDPGVPLMGVETGEGVLRASWARVSLTLLLLGVAAGISLLLGVVGIFGVVGYAVERRTREMGIRKALGARPGQIRRLVLRQGAGVFVGGVATGALLALLLARSLGSLLHGVESSDPVTFLVAGGLVLGAAFLAAALPARRAARTDPVRTLGAE